MYILANCVISFQKIAPAKPHWVLIGKFADFKKTLESKYGQSFIEIVKNFLFFQFGKYRPQTVLYLLKICIGKTEAGTNLKCYSSLEDTYNCWNF